MRAPELLLAPFVVTATALPLMSALDFCLFTTIWDDPKEFEASRLDDDILSICGNTVFLGAYISSR